MRIGLLTDGGYPYTTGESRLWCDRLVRGLARHEFDIYALSRTAAQEERGWVALPPHVRRVRTAPLWGTQDGGHVRARSSRARRLGRRERDRFATCLRELAGAICMAGPGGADGERGLPGVPGRADVPTGVPGRGGPVVADLGEPGRGGDPDALTVAFETVASGELGAPSPGAGGGSAPGAGGGSSRFAEALYGLADLASEYGGLSTVLRSETAVRVLEAACRTPGAGRAMQAARVPDYLAFADILERALRPLSLDWYDAAGLGDVDLCHAAGGGCAALPGLLAKRFFGVPLLVTEYGVRLRAQYLAAGDARVPVRALTAAFHRRLAAEVYERAALITPGNTHTRRWQEKCGADRAKLRTVYPGMAADRFQSVGEGEGADAGDPMTLVWVGRVDPTKDLIALLHAFAEIRRAEPDARLRIFYAGRTPGAAPGTQLHGPGPGPYGYGDAPGAGRDGGAAGPVGPVGPVDGDAGAAAPGGEGFRGDGFGGAVVRGAAFGGAAFGGGAFGAGAKGFGANGFGGVGRFGGPGCSGSTGHGPGGGRGSRAGHGAGSGYAAGAGRGVGPGRGDGAGYGAVGAGYGAGSGSGYAAGSGYGSGSADAEGVGYGDGPNHMGGYGDGPGHAGGYGGGAHAFGSPLSSSASTSASVLSPEAAAYLAHCRALAAHLFPDEAVDAHAVGDNPVSFEEIGGPGAPELADAYAGGSVVVLSSVVEGFPVSLVEAMLCGRATVSTDTGAVVEVIGGTGLVVPPRNPRALADACLALLRDPERRERLGAAARARALELFTVEQNLAAFRGIYLELMSHCPVRREAVDESGAPVPFAHPAESHVPGSWTALTGSASYALRRPGSAHAEEATR
ncbi:MULTISPECIES: DUF3492 domain-containing protein [unclassified Streptomyces]|uniref:DUF3492 domain-containing protein n=1 Tax=unclassified Streptomyces TaxID=2593676 RepID=UPI0033FECE87